MIIRTSVAVLLALASGLAGCGVLHTPTTGDQISGRNYTAAAISWKSGQTFYYFVGARPEAGKVAICGAWTTDNMTALGSGVIQETFDGISVSLDGDRILSNLNFMEQVSYAGDDPNDFLGAPTACVLTDEPWLERYDGVRPDIRVPRRRISV